MQVSVYDVFAETPYAGNQAAVLRAHRVRLTDAQFVAVAGELALAETALLALRGRDVALRFATTDRLIHRCGHATLAGIADHVLTKARGRACNGRYRVGTSVAEWHARPLPDRCARHEADGLQVAVEWPDRPQFVSPIPARAVCRALQLDVRDLAAGLPRCIYNSGNINALVPVRSYRALARAEPDWARLKRLFATFKLTDLHLYCVKGRRSSTATIRLSCRNLFPYGVFEESATGTASVALATALIDRWSALRGRRAVNFVFEQGIGRRRGKLRVRFLADGRGIWLDGFVFRILRGELRSLPG